MVEILAILAHSIPGPLNAIYVRCKNMRGTGPTYVSVGDTPLFELPYMLLMRLNTSGRATEDAAFRALSQNVLAADVRVGLTVEVIISSVAWVIATGNLFGIGERCQRLLYGNGPRGVLFIMPSEPGIASYVLISPPVGDVLVFVQRPWTLCRGRLIRHAGMPGLWSTFIAAAAAAAIC